MLKSPCPILSLDNQREARSKFPNLRPVKTRDNYWDVRGKKASQKF